MWDGFIDPIASVFGQDADSQRNNLGTDASGKYKPTFGDRFWGRADEGQDVLDKMENKRVKDLVGDRLELAGGTYTEDMSVGEAGAEIRRLEADRTRQAEITARQDAYNDPTRVQERREARLDRAERADERADDMKLRIMQMDREDQRYNDRLDREERARRKESIMSLSQGLAALGAAFAL